MPNNESLERRLKFLMIWAIVTTVGLIVVAVMLFRLMGPVTILRAERIEVVESDGRPSLIIANSQRIPGPILDGVELPRELSQGRIGSAGMIFFSPRGDEIGGLTYRLQESDEGYQASSALMFDQYRQDQVVGIQYGDSGNSRLAGFRVWDRSAEVPISDLIDLLSASRQSGPEAEQARKELEAAAARGDLGAERIFLGSRNKVAEVILHDTRGRPRLRLAVDQSDTPFLEFLDEEGNLVRRLPE